MPLSKDTSVAGAMIIVVAFLAFTFYVASRAETETPEAWNRLYAVFSSIEALGFAAAGLILGRTIDIPSRQEMRSLQESNAELSVRAKDAKSSIAEAQREIESAKKILTESNDMSVARPKATLALERALTRANAAQFTPMHTTAEKDN